MVRRAIAGGAWVHTPSQFVADEVVAEFGVDPGRVRAVHHGVPSAGPHRRRARLAGRAVSRDAGSIRRRPADGDVRYVLAVGTIEPRKDYPGLVRAFERVADDPIPTSPW